MKKQSSAEPLWTKDFVLLIITAIFMYISTFMFTPTLPLFVRSIGTVDPSVGGLIVFAYTIGCLVPRLIWGKLADSWERKPVYLIGVLIIAAVSPFYGLFVSVAGILFFRMIQGVGFSGSSTTAGTIAADLVPASRRAEGIGFYSLANTIGMALGPALGLYMLQQHSSWGLFGASFLFGLVSLGIGMFLNYEKKRRLAQSGSTFVKKASIETAVTTGTVKIAPKRVALFEKSVLTTCLVLFFIVMPYGGIMTYIASYGNDLGVGEIGLYFTMFSVALFLVRLMVGRLSDRHGITVILIPGIVLMIGGLIVLYWAAAGLAVFLVSAVLFGLGYGAVMPVLQATALTFCQDNRRGAASATFFSVADLAIGLGAIVLGMWIKYFGYETAFAGMAVSEVIAFAFFITILSPQLQSRRRMEAAADTNKAEVTADTVKM